MCDWFAVKDHFRVGSFWLSSSSMRDVRERVVFGLTVSRHSGERAPLLFFESQRWRLYERGQASRMEEEAVAGLRKLKGGRCRVW